MSAMPPSEQTARQNARALWLGLGLIVLGFFALAIDLPAAIWFRTHTNHDLWKPIKLAEIFAHGWGIALLGLGLYVLVPQRRHCLVQILTSAWGAGLLANLGKLMISRSRPRTFWLPEVPLQNFPEFVSATFLDWFPEWTGQSDIQSCPSSHAATVGGLAFALCVVFPHGRWYFLFLGLLAGLQRLVEGAHFPSDVLWGWGLGIIVGFLVFSAKPLPRSLVSSG